MTPHSPKSWTLDGSSSATWLGEAHKQPHVRIFRTSILETGRPSFLSPCSSKIQVKEMFAHGYSALDTTDSTQTLNGENLGQSVFLHTANDNKLALSMDDPSILQIMEDEYRQDKSKSWVSPLPFQSPRKQLPNNREYAKSRLNSLSRTLSKQPQMKAHYLEFVEKMLTNKHAEIAPPLQEGQERTDPCDFRLQCTLQRSLSQRHTPHRP